MSTATKWSTLPEVEEYVAESLGEYAADYDLAAIARQLASWDGRAFAINPEYDNPDDTGHDAYWSMVALHEVP